MFSVITNIYNKKTEGPTLMELFTATGKVKFFLTTIDVRDVCLSPVVHASNIYSCQKKNFFSFPVALNNSLKVGLLVFCYKCF